ncbi:MAG: metallophosphoesterase [Oscillospiraceae bacterium]|nr:metallophosphoesterase [Oscillospiraceae bacterium]
MSSHTVRRLFSSALLASVLLSAMPVSALAQTPEKETDSLTLYIAADPHYIAPTLTDHGSYFLQVVEKADGKYMSGCEELTDAFIEQVIREKPDALILPGDLSFNGARESHLALAGKLGRVRDAGIPVLVIPGNHDLNNRMAASFHGSSFTLVDSVGPEEFAEIYADFGYRDALSRDSGSLSYVAELSEDTWALMADVNTPSAPGSVTEDFLRWVREQLELARSQGKRVIAVSHQTLLAHTFLTAGIVIAGAERLLALYEEYGVLCNLSGHMHIQHIQHSESGLPDIAGGALITWPNQFGVLTLGQAAADYRTERVDTSSLPDFNAEAFRFLQETDRRQVAAELLSLGVEDAENALRDYMAGVNMTYIAGRGDTLDWETPLYAQWQTVPSLYAYYLRTVREDGENHTELSFSYSD